MDTETTRMEASIAQQIRVELADRGMTQAALADAMGTGPDDLSRYLMGHRSMTRTFYKLAEALEIAPSVILGRAQERLAKIPADQSPLPRPDSPPE